MGDMGLLRRLVQQTMAGAEEFMPYIERPEVPTGVVRVLTKDCLVFEERQDDRFTIIRDSSCEGEVVGLEIERFDLLRIVHSVDRASIACLLDVEGQCREFQINNNSCWTLFRATTPSHLIVGFRINNPSKWKIDPSII